MSEPLMGPAGDEPGYESPPPSWGLVVLGALVGFVAAFFIPLLGMNVLDQFSLGGAQAGFLALVLGPAVLGVVALLVPTWRRAAAGFVMGLAIGAIAFAGVCATFISSFGW